MNHDKPLRDWTREQQRWLALKAAELFEPLLISLGFDADSAKSKVQPYIANIDNRLDEFAQRAIMNPASTSFAASDPPPLFVPHGKLGFHVRDLLASGCF